MFRIMARPLPSIFIPTLIVCGVWAGGSCKLKPTVVDTPTRVSEIPTPPAQSSVATSDWKRIDLKAFSFSLPPGMKEKIARGIDSIIWKYADDSMELVIDLGPYSRRPEVYETKPEYRQEQIEISGKKADMISFHSDNPNFREQSYVAAVYFSEVGSTEAKLSFTVHSKSRRGREVAEAIFRSIRFPESVKSAAE